MGAAGGAGGGLPERFKVVFLYSHPFPPGGKLVSYFRSDHGQGGCPGTVAQVKAAVQCQGKAAGAIKETQRNPWGGNHRGPDYRKAQHPPESIGESTRPRPLLVRNELGGGTDS